MTNDLEKQFFDTFGIEPRITGYEVHGVGLEVVSQEPIYEYPTLSDRILLELICIHNQYSHPFSIYGEKKDFLKNDILECMINILDYFDEHEMGEYSKLKHQVQALFEEG